MTDKQETIDTLREMIVTEDDLSYMNDLSDDMLGKVFHEFELYKHRIEESQKPLYQVMAQVSKLVPNFLMVKLAKEYLTPYVMAQVSKYMDPKASAQLGKSFDPEMLAEVALYADLKLSATIADKMGVNEVAKITGAMIRVGYFIKLGEMSDYMSHNMLVGLIPKIPNNADMARIAYNMTDAGRIEHVASRLPRPRVQGVFDELKGLGESAAVAIYEARL